MENSNIEKLDGLARWFGSSVASAFFASLERCSCVNLNTNDSDDEEDDGEAKDVPLMLTTPIPSHIDPDNSNPSSTTVVAQAASVETLPV